MKAVGASKIGLVRQKNEDRFFVDDHVVIVADGMGGYSGGEIASAIVIEDLKKSFSMANVADQDDLKEILHKANHEVWQYTKEYSELEGMGTTTVIAYCKDDKHLFWASVGDSRLYLLHDNKLELITKDHSLVQDLIDNGELQEEDRLSYPMKNYLTRAIGVEPYVQIDAGTLEVAAGDRILLCSDGLSAFISQEEIERTLLKDQTDEEAIEELMNAVYNVGAKDNVTIILGRIEDTRGDNHDEG